MKILVDKEKIWYAEIHAARSVDKGAYLEKDDVGHENRFYKTIEDKVYDSALVLEVANGKYIDLAEVYGAIDYLKLSTAAKFKKENKRLLSWGYDTKYEVGKGYVRYLRSAYSDDNPHLKEIVFGEGKISLSDAIEEALKIRMKETELEQE